MGAVRGAATEIAIGGNTLCCKGTKALRHFAADQHGSGRTGANGSIVLSIHEGNCTGDHREVSAYIPARLRCSSYISISCSFICALSSIISVFGGFPALVSAGQSPNPHPGKRKIPRDVSHTPKRNFHFFFFNSARTAFPFLLKNENSHSSAVHISLAS